MPSLGWRMASLAASRGCSNVIDGERSARLSGVATRRDGRGVPSAQAGDHATSNVLAPNDITLGCLKSVGNRAEVPSSLNGLLRIHGVDFTTNRGGVPARHSSPARG